MADYDKILFSTAYPIDKVVATGTNSYTIPFNVTAFYSDSGTFQGNTITNPAGKRCLIRFAWSLDGINYYAPEALLEYEFHIDAHIIGGPSDSGPINGVRAAASMTNNASNITMYAYNGYHGNVTYTAGNDSYSGISQTFYYKWALFEIT